MDAKTRLARNRLQWVENARLGLLSAIGEDIIHPTFQVFPTVDPIRFILKIVLKEPLDMKFRKPIRAYLRGWAKEFNCDVPTIDFKKFWIQAEVLTHERVWSRDSLGKFKKAPKFDSGAR